MRLFKHMESKYADLLLNDGIVMISNLRGYQNIEHNAIKDVDEGNLFITYTTQGKDLLVKIKNSEDKEYRVLTEEENGNQLMVVTQSQLIRKILAMDVYTYCTSMSYEKNLFEGYDTCIEITDFEFFKIIANELLKMNLIWYNKYGLINLEVAREIVYKEKREVEGENHDILPWFIKDISFKKEQEFRVIFTPKNMNKYQILKPVFLKLPELKKYCKIIW